MTHIKCPLPSCGKESLAFDPFMAMPLPITGPQMLTYYEVYSDAEEHCFLKSRLYQKGMTPQRFLEGREAPPFPDLSLYEFQ